MKANVVVKKEEVWQGAGLSHLGDSSHCIVDDKQWTGVLPSCLPDVHRKHIIIVFLHFSYVLYYIYQGSYLLVVFWLIF